MKRKKRRREDGFGIIFLIKGEFLALISSFLLMNYYTKDKEN